MEGPHFALYVLRLLDAAGLISAQVSPLPLLLLTPPLSIVCVSFRVMSCALFMCMLRHFCPIPTPEVSPCRSSFLLPLSSFWVYFVLQLQSMIGGYKAMAGRRLVSIGHLDPGGLTPRLPFPSFIVWVLFGVWVLGLCIFISFVLVVAFSW